MALVVIWPSGISPDPDCSRATGLGPVLKMQRASLKMAPPSIYKNIRHLVLDYHSQRPLLITAGHIA